MEHDLRLRYAPDLDFAACTSCTAGLTAALLALGVAGPVLIPAFTFPATRSAVEAAGVPALLGEVEPGTGVLAAAAVERAVRAGGLAAVLAVRPYGIWGDISELSEACRRHGLPLVVDNASGFGAGAEIVARYACPDAIEVFSLHATKPAAVGEGGLIMHPAVLHGALRTALNFGMAPGTAEVHGRGLNGKMDEIRASVARAMLEVLPARVVQRQAMAATLGRLASASADQPFAPPGQEERAPWQCFPLLLRPGVDPEAVVAGCAAAGLIVRRYYHPLLAGTGATPNAAALSARALCLPVYDGAEAEEAEAMWDVFACVMARIPGG